MQAWLIRAAELKSGRSFKPDALVTFLPTASLVSQAKRLRGLTISVEKERAVRKVLDTTRRKAPRALDRWTLGRDIMTAPAISRTCGGFAASAEGGLQGSVGASR